MRIYIQSGNFELSNLYRAHIEDRINYIFRHLKRDVKSISIHINNTSENLNSTEARSQVRVETTGLPLIYAEQKSDDMYIAVIGSAHRARKNVSRKLNKVNTLMKQLRSLKKKKISSNTLRLNRPHNQGLQYFA